MKIRGCGAKHAVKMYPCQRSDNSSEVDFKARWIALQGKINNRKSHFFLFAILMLPHSGTSNSQDSRIVQMASFKWNFVLPSPSKQQQKNTTPTTTKTNNKETRKQQQNTLVKCCVPSFLIPHFHLKGVLKEGSSVQALKLFSSAKGQECRGLEQGVFVEGAFHLFTGSLHVSALPSGIQPRTYLVLTPATRSLFSALPTSTWP